MSICFSNLFQTGIFVLEFLDMLYLLLLILMSQQPRILLAKLLHLRLRHGGLVTQQHVHPFQAINLILEGPVTLLNLFQRSLQSLLLLFETTA